MQIIKKIMNTFFKERMRDMTSNSPEEYNGLIHVEKEKYSITINRKPIATTAIFLSLVRFPNNFFNNSFIETKATILKLPRNKLN